MWNKSLSCGTLEGWNFGKFGETGVVFGDVMCSKKNDRGVIWHCGRGRMSYGKFGEFVVEWIGTRKKEYVRYRLL